MYFCFYLDADFSFSRRRRGSLRGLPLGHPYPMRGAITPMAMEAKRVFQRIALGPSVPDEGSHNSYGDGGNSGLCERLRVGELARESEDKRKICAKEKLKDMKRTYDKYVN